MNLESGSYGLFNRLQHLHAGYWDILEGRRPHLFLGLKGTVPLRFLADICHWQSPSSIPCIHFEVDTMDG
jgi:hypothetical protein